jgi:putative Mn2+ efflux pump MntP
VYLKLILLVIPLALDTFAVSAALGMTPVPASRKLKISLFFTAFEAGMPLIGLLMGEPLRRLVGSRAEFIAYGLLVAFGLYTLIHNEATDRTKASQITKKWGLGALVLGLAISIDEVAIGLTLGLLGFPIIPVLAVIAAQAFIFSQAGFWLGSRLKEKYREQAEKIAGLALIGIGVFLFLTHPT